MSGIDPIKYAFEQKQKARIASQERMMRNRMQQLAQEGDR